jgi:hypothetical protein
MRSDPIRDPRPMGRMIGKTEDAGWIPRGAGLAGKASELASEGAGENCACGEEEVPSELMAARDDSLEAHPHAIPFLRRSRLRGGFLVSRMKAPVRRPKFSWSRAFHSRAMTVYY